MRALRLGTVVVACLMFASHGWAANLTRSDVENFLAALNDLQEVAAQYVAASDDDPEETQRFSHAVALMRAAGVEDMDDIAERHEFADADAWGAVGDRVIGAYIALTMDAQEADINAQLAQARKMIEANVRMTDEQRDLALAQMRRALRDLEAVKAAASDQDIEVVREFVPEIDAALQGPVN